MTYAPCEFPTTFAEEVQLLDTSPVGYLPATDQYAISSTAKKGYIDPQRLSKEKDPA